MAQHNEQIKQVKVGMASHANERTRVGMTTLFVYCVEPLAHLFVWFLSIC